ncbi:MAG: hypothetical protein HGA85_04330 [Nanoarchaeota archaeon]|nr:hypothetical protein [Nanoarchaeota archaeon]
MGTILSSRVREDGKVIFEIVVSYDEALQLKGHMENVYIFSEQNSKIKTGISQRGKNDATKYFLIPKDYRNDLLFSKDVLCQCIDTKTKSAFIYLVNKNGYKPKENTNRN